MYKRGISGGGQVVPIMVIDHDEHLTMPDPRNVLLNSSTPFQELRQMKPDVAHRSVRDMVLLRDQLRNVFYGPFPPQRLDVAIYPQDIVVPFDESITMEFDQ